MNDDRFERDLREVLVEDGQDAVRRDFRERIAALSRSPAYRPRSSRLLRIQTVVGGLAAAAVIVLVGGVLLVGRPTVGPAPTVSVAPTSTPSQQGSLPPTADQLGRTWVTVPATGDLAGASFSGVIAYHDGFIAVGKSGPTPGIATAWTSPDGIRWTNHVLSTSDTWPSTAIQIVAGPNGPLAFGTRMNPKGETIPVVWSSPDFGTVWKEADLPAPPALDRSHRGIFQPATAASGAAGVVVIATCTGEAPGPPCPPSSYLWQSTDGITWRLLTFPEQHVSLASLAAAGPGFVVGGAREGGAVAAIWISSDGEAWSSVGRLPDSTRAPNGDFLSVEVIAVDPDGIIALSPHAGMSVPARAWASSDGQTWHLAADLTDRWFGLYSQPIWTSLGFLAVGWTAAGVTPPTYPDPFVAEQRNLLRSPDGIRWEVLPTPKLPEGDGIGPIAVTADRIVAATGHAILVSPSSVMSSPTAPVTPSAAPVNARPVPALTVDHPNVTVTPSRGLTDGQSVEVRVTGFGVGGKVFISECASAADASDLGCGRELAAQALIVTGDDRAGSVTFTVSAQAASRWPSATLWRCPDQCVIVATVGGSYSYASAPISFIGR